MKAVNKKNLAAAVLLTGTMAFAMDVSTIAIIGITGVIVMETTIGTVMVATIVMIGATGAIGIVIMLGIGIAIGVENGTETGIGSEIGAAIDTGIVIRNGTGAANQPSSETRYLQANLC